jgi:hypothetical protein
MFFLYVKYTKERTYFGFSIIFNIFPFFPHAEKRNLSVNRNTGETVLHKASRMGYDVSFIDICIYIIILRIQALSLVESHDLLEDRRTELRHN